MPQIAQLPVAVIKPIYGAASIGVVRVNNMAELRKTYKKVVKEMAGARIVAGALQQAEASDDDEPADGSAKPVRQEVSSLLLGSTCADPGSLQHKLGDICIRSCLPGGAPVLGQLAPSLCTAVPPQRFSAGSIQGVLMLNCCCAHAQHHSPCLPARDFYSMVLLTPPVCLQGNASSWIKMTLMLEEYLDGPEVDVDLVISEGQVGLVVLHFWFC